MLTADHLDGSVHASVGDAQVVWQVSGLDEDYRALRGSCGVVDLTGTGLLAVRGDGAVDFLNDAMTREVTYLARESSLLGLLLRDDGGIVDCVTLYRRDDGFLVETSVGRGGVVAAHLQGLAGARSDVDVQDVGEDLAVVGFEGPQAAQVAVALASEDIDGLPFRAVRPVTLAEGEALVCRSGVSGEFGYRVIGSRSVVSDVWKRLCGLGVPVGLDALELTMLEVRQPIVHREADDPEATVARTGLAWLVEYGHDGFVGRDAVMREFEAGPDVRTVGFATDAGVTAEPGDTVTTGDGERLGTVVHARRSPVFEGVAGLARLRADVAVPGLRLIVGSGDREAALRTVSAPMVVPASWAALLG